MQKSLELLSKLQQCGCSQSAHAGLVCENVTVVYTDHLSSSTGVLIFRREAAILGIRSMSYFAYPNTVTWNCLLFYSVFLYFFSSMFCVMYSLWASVESEVVLSKHLFPWKISGICFSTPYLLMQPKRDANISLLCFPPCPPVPSHTCFLSLLPTGILHSCPVLSLFTVLRTAQFAHQSQQPRPYEAVKATLSFC